jgi:hypothetical protein
MRRSVSTLLTSEALYTQSTCNTMHYAGLYPDPWYWGKGSTWREEFVDTYGERVQRDPITEV